MERIETNLKDCFILEPKRFGDHRGYFESTTREDLGDFGFNGIHQISNSLSGKGIVRGLHFQKDPYCQAKVVRCHRGGVLDVVVDMRKDSPSYGQWTSVELTPENGRMLYVPRGFAHGFVSLSDDTLFEYYVDNQYMPRLEGGILWNDPALNINWDEVFEKYGIIEPVLSEKDKVRCTLDECDVEFRREPKKFLITGASGQLGYDLIRELYDRGEYNVYAPSSKEMDIRDRKQVMKLVSEYKPDVIFHCAAFTSVDKAETSREVNIVNALGTSNITAASLETGSKLIYTSTDYVFDGKKNGIYTEEDEPNPMNKYGFSKLVGEEEVKRNPNSIIARISWVFGINGNNFVKTMLKLSDNHKELTVVDDQVGSPTYTVDLAKNLVEMAYTNKTGIYNITNNGYCSWAEFAKYIMESNNKDTRIIPVSTEEYYKGKDLSSIAYRPRNSRLDKTKLVENGFALLPDWMDATDRYCKELKQNRLILRR